MTASTLVKSLLEAEEDIDPKSFIGRHDDDITLKTEILVALDDNGVNKSDIDGIEIYGMVEGFYRADPGDPNVILFGVSVHTPRGNQMALDGGGLFHVGEYRTADEAMLVAKALREMFPRTHFVNEL